MWRVAGLPPGERAITAAVLSRPGALAAAISRLGMPRGRPLPGGASQPVNTWIVVSDRAVRFFAYDARRRGPGAEVAALPRASVAGVRLEPGTVTVSVWLDLVGAEPIEFEQASFGGGEQLARLSAALSPQPYIG